MAAPKRLGPADRHNRAHSVCLDRTGIARNLAAVPGGLADRDSDNPYREQLCGQPAAQRLRNRSGHLVVSAIRDNPCGYRLGTAEAETDLTTLTNAMGPFTSSEKIEDLLFRFGGLRGLMTADAEELTAFLDNKADAAKISAILALAANLQTPELIEHPVIYNCADLISYLQTVMGTCRVETFRVLFLDTHNKIIADEVLWTGTVSEVQAYPREIMRRALELDSSAIIAAHNHPSSVVAPSSSDIAMTRKLLAAAHTLNIAFHDHIIVSATNYHSMRVHKSIEPWS